MISGRIVKTGMGGFLNPPYHPEHNYSVETDLRRHRDNRGGMSLSAALGDISLPLPVRQAAARLLSNWACNRPHIDSEAVRDWIAQVLGYFRGCYKGQGETPWSAGDLRIAPEADPMLNSELHAGVHCIRGYYPEYRPTQADFDGAYWGQKPEPGKAERAPLQCRCCLAGCHDWPGCESAAVECGLDLGIVGHPSIDLCAECADHWSATGRFEHLYMVKPDKAERS